MLRIPKRAEAGQGGGGDARERVQTLQQRTADRGIARHHCGAELPREVGNYKMIGAEAEILMAEIPQRPREKARAGEQHQRERHLRGDQPASERAAASSYAARRAGGRESGRESEQHRSERRDRDGERGHAPIPIDRDGSAPAASATSVRDPH